MFSLLFFCLSVSNFAQKRPKRICMKCSGKVGNGPMYKRLNFSGDPDHRLHKGIVYRTRHYWEIRKVVNGHKAAAHTDSPDGGTGKTCLV